MAHDVPAFLLLCADRVILFPKRVFAIRSEVVVFALCGLSSGYVIRVKMS